MVSIIDVYKRQVFIEAKGQVNDVFPVKFKMFRQLIESYPDHDKYLIFEIFGKRQLLEAIKAVSYTHLDVYKRQMLKLQIVQER